MRPPRLSVRRHRSPSPRASAPSGLLQRLADESPVHQRIAALQRQAEPVLQRNEEDGEDAGPAQETVIVSMDGDKIGSIYFGDGRIRTTHASGPEDDRGKQRNIHRFNIDREAANADYIADKKAGKTKKAKLNWYIRERLEAGTPTWAAGGEVTDAASAPADAPDDRKLFEYYETDPVHEKDSGRRVHPSRGAAIQITRAAEDIATLKAAVALVREDQTASQNNRSFFTKVLEDGSALKTEIRMPEEVDAEVTERALKTLTRCVAKLEKVNTIDLSMASKKHRERCTKYAKEAADLGRDSMRTALSAAQAARDVSYRASETLDVKLAIRAKNAAIRASDAETKAEAAHAKLLAEFAKFQSK